MNASTSGLTINIHPGVPAGYAARYQASSITPAANGTALSSWPDSSGNGYHATQGDVTSQPQYVTASQTIAGLKPGVWFSTGVGNNNIGGDARQYFTIPTALVTNLVSCTIFVIGESGYSNGQFSVMVGLGQNSGIGPMDYQQTLGYHQGGVWNAMWADTGLPTGPYAVCLESTASAITMSSDFTSATAPGNSPLALAGGAIGSAYANTYTGGSSYLYAYQGLLQEIVIYARSITPAERTALFAYAVATYGTAAAKRTNNLIWFGNSVFLQWGATTDGGMTALCAKKAGMNYTQMTGVNLSILGAGFTQLYNNVSNVTNQIDWSLPLNICCIYDGDQDLQNGLTAAQIYSEQQQLVQSLQSGGFKVVSSSLTNHNYSGAQLATFNAYNTLLRQTPLGDAFADIAAHPAFATYNAAYMSDTSNPNNSGHAILASIFESAVLSLMGGGGGTLAISANTFPAGKVGTAYSISQYASGGKTPYTFSATGLPTGLSVNPSNGMITGTPSVAVTAQAVTVSVHDSTTPTPQTASTSGLTVTISP
jgi:Putative Ig domain